MPVTYSERSGRGAWFDALPPDAEPRAAGLERGELLELRRLGFQALEQRIREHPPAILRAALHAAVVAVADAIQARRIADRQRPQHDRVDEREDRGRAADAEAKREHGGGSEDRRLAELAEDVS